MYMCYVKWLLRVSTHYCLWPMNLKHPWAHTQENMVFVKFRHRHSRKEFNATIKNTKVSTYVYMRDEHTSIQSSQQCMSPYSQCAIHVCTSLQVFFAVKTCTCMIVTVCCVSLHRPYTMNDWSIFYWWAFCVVWQFTIQ